VDEEPRPTAVWWLLMLFNLTRKTETCLIENAEIVWESERGPYLIIPAWKAKNHQSLYQPLTPYSDLLLRLALKHCGGSRWAREEGRPSVPAYWCPGVSPEPAHRDDNLTPRPPAHSGDDHGRAGRRATHHRCPAESQVAAEHGRDRHLQ